jgi:predicted nuclease with TOPRIM domain
MPLCAGHRPTQISFADTATQHAERSISEDGSEVTKVLETLVADNEDLKRSSTELQSLLQESRDDVRALQQELEELRVITPPANREHTLTSLRFRN